MTISQTSEYVLEHPFFKRAMEKASLGDTRDMKFVLDLLQIDVYQETAALCTRTFRRFKDSNYPIIEHEIREVNPPTRLSIHLPIPEICTVVSITTIKEIKEA